MPLVVLVSLLVDVRLRISPGMPATHCGACSPVGLVGLGQRRSAAARYDADSSLADLIATLRAASRRFDELWRGGGVARHHEDRKTVQHPEVGDITVDCDVLTIHGNDLRVVVMTTVPGSVDAANLALVKVIGLRSMGKDTTDTAGTQPPLGEAAFHPGRNLRMSALSSMRPTRSSPRSRRRRFMSSGVDCSTATSCRSGLSARHATMISGVAKCSSRPTMLMGRAPGPRAGPRPVSGGTAQGVGKVAVSGC